MNDDKRKKNTDILTNEAYELLFGHLNEEKKQKKKEKKKFCQKEKKREKNQILNLNILIISNP